MKQWLWLMGLGMVAAIGFAAEPWSRRVTTEEFKAAGLDKLSPQELAQLDALVGKYGAPPAGQVRAPEPEAAARLADAEARARRAEQEAAAAREAAQTAKAEQKKAEEGFFAKAKRVIVAPGTTVEIAAVETEIDGDFTGWEAKTGWQAATSWKLKDGTTWRVDNPPQAYWSKATKNVKVKIYPAAMGGYWMDLVDLHVSVHVRQVK